MRLSTCYEILRLAPGATAADVRRAYRRLALCHHPDHNIRDREANARFARVGRAYRALMDYLEAERPDAFGECGVCGRFARRYEATDGRRCCGRCLLGGARRCLPPPVYRLVRFYGVITLLLAGGGMLWRAARTGDPAWHASAAACAALAMAWLAGRTIAVTLAYDPAGRVRPRRPRRGWPVCRRQS